VRITGGTACGQKLAGPRLKERAIRPTSDRVREALFNILGEKIIEASVLDLFSGTGAFGLEALSRGASSVVLVDHALSALQLIGTNLQQCFTQPRARVFKLDLSKKNSLHQLKKQLPRSYKADLVFLDPPYEKQLAKPLLQMVQGCDLVSAEATIIVEERANQDLPEVLDQLQLYDKRRYGETGLWFYTHTL